MRIRWRNLEMPSRVTVERTTLTDSYGQFMIEPFERGFGHTIGNGLRRVLLSVLEGVAVRWVKIKGALHEFQAVEGVVEDVADIVLQVKQLRVRLGGDGPAILRIRKSEKGVVTAGDIKVEGDATIVNPDLRICTLSKKTDFEMEMEAVRGRGYMTAEDHEVGGGRYSDPSGRKNAKDVDQEIGKIWVDSIFSPVLRVKYVTQDTRVGKLTDYDRLVMEIWTDGSIRPEEALAEASKIYRKCLNPLVSFGALGGELPASDGVKAEVGSDRASEALLSKPIVDLALSVRASNCLESEKITTVGELIARSPEDLLAVRNFGKNTLTEIRQKLAELGMKLRGDDAEVSPDAGADVAD
jgi:DNA-directed RNA polymerase subunit alpha